MWERAPPWGTQDLSLARGCWGLLTLKSLGETWVAARAPWCRLPRASSTGEVAHAALIRGLLLAAGGPEGWPLPQARFWAWGAVCALCCHGLSLWVWVLISSAHKNTNRTG